VKENEQIEFKEQYSNSFLKTVSAFANEREGKIYFGIDDKGTVLGFATDDKTQLKIGNAINDTISPMPNYQLEVKTLDEKEILVLTVFKGENAPYFYKGKAYRRINSATLPADSFQTQQWAMESKRVSFDELIANEQSLSFEKLEKELQEKLLVSRVTDDVLKTMSLLIGEKYTNAGMLLADTNSYRYGIDVVQFGETKSVFLNRVTLTNISIITQYYAMLELFENYYADFEEVVEGERVRRIQIPRNAFREAIANAIVHRNYSLKANIQVEFWADRIVINSPGGLPEGIREQEFLSGGVTFLRNELLANAFRRLGIIESFATGIWRIKNAYQPFVAKPVFSVSPNIISVTLPVVNYTNSNRRISMFTAQEEELISLLETGEKKRSEIEKQLGIGTTQTVKILNQLIDKNVVEKIGSGRAVRYKLY